MGPVVSHIPCHLAQQERLRDARLARLAGALRRRRRVPDQPVTAEAAEAAFRGSPDVWASLRF